MTAAIHGSAMDLKSPIFILGCQRSGTSLLAYTLSRLPAVEMSRETEFFHYVYRRRRTFGDLRVTRNRTRLVDAYLALELNGWKKIVDPERAREYLLREATDYRLFLAALLRFFAESQGKPRGGEQRADTRLAEKYCEWFPEARILHIVRDPRDVVQSLMTMPWGARNVVTNARWWRQQNLAALRLEGRTQYLRLRYEDLVRQPESELKRVCAFLDEPYSPDIMTPGGGARSELSWLKRAEQSINTSRMGLWHKSFSSAEIGLVEWIAGPLLGTFGYQVEGPAPSDGAKMTALAREAVEGIARRIDEFPGVLYYVARSANFAGEEAAKVRSYNRRAAAMAGSRK